MPTPGFNFNGVFANGLIGNVAWGEWQTERQVASMFDIPGISVINGARKNRAFSFPFQIWGFSSVSARDTVINAMEASLLQVGNLTGYTAADTIFNYQFCQLMQVKRDKDRWDGINLYNAQLTIGFEQLAPSN
jgi:hypothetical protein